MQLDEAEKYDLSPKEKEFIKNFMDNDKDGEKTKKFIVWALTNDNPALPGMADLFSEDSNFGTFAGIYSNNTPSAGPRLFQPAVKTNEEAAKQIEALPAFDKKTPQSKIEERKKQFVLIAYEIFHWIDIVNKTREAFGQKPETTGDKMIEAFQSKNPKDDEEPGEQETEESMEESFEDDEFESPLGEEDLMGDFGMIPSDEEPGEKYGPGEIDPAAATYGPEEIEDKEDEEEF